MNKNFTAVLALKTLVLTLFVSILFFVKGSAQQPGIGLEKKNDSTQVINWGTVILPVNMVAGAEVVFREISISNANLPEVDLDESWLGEDGTELEYEWDTTETSLRIWRGDFSPASGEGEICKLGGGGILVLEDLFKQQQWNISEIKLIPAIYPLFKLFPNPTPDFLTIETSSCVDLQVWDFKGKLVLFIPHFCGGTVDLTALEKGIFLIKAGTLKQKFVRN